MIDVFTLKRISPTCLFKSNHRQGKISILIPGYLWNLSLRCVAHRWDDLGGTYVAHRGDHLCSVLHTAEIFSVVCTEIISAVVCTLRRSSPWYPVCCNTAEMISVVCCTPWRSSLRCVAHPQRQLPDLISRWNQNRIWKYLSLFIRGPDRFESWKKLEVKNLVTHSL